jgi:hypothetical protein
MHIVIISIAVVAVVGLLMWFVLNDRHPESASTHLGSQGEAGNRAGSAAFFGDTNDRPAGPGAEADGVAGRGRPAPGPSAEGADDGQVM